MPTGDKTSSRRTAAATRSANVLPIVEVPLTASARAADATAARLNVAWVLFGAFGLATLLAATVSAPRTGAPSAAGLVVPLYVLTIAALVWAAVEILRPRH